MMAGQETKMKNALKHFREVSTRPGTGIDFEDRLVDSVQAADLLAEAVEKFLHEPPKSP